MSPPICPQLPVIFYYYTVISLFADILPLLLLKSFLCFTYPSICCSFSWWASLFFFPFFLPFKILQIFSVFWFLPAIKQKIHKGCNKVLRKWLCSWTCVGRRPAFLGNSVKWWQPQDTESIRSSGRCKTDKRQINKKRKEKACFSKGKNTQIKVNCNSMAYMSFMKSYKKSLFGNPTINLQLFKVSFHFSWLLTQEHPEKPGSLQGCSRVPIVGSHRRSMWGDRPGFPFPLLLTVASINASLSGTPYQHFWSDPG